MSTGAIALLPGHGNRPGGWDPGARSPAGWDEADLVRQVAAAMFLELQRHHIPTEIVAVGSYAERGQDADAGAGTSLVVQLHIDASPEDVGPDRGSVYYWPSPPGHAAPGLPPAQALATALAAVVPWPVRVEEAAEKWPGPRACLAAVRATSVLLELGFTDGPRGQVELPRLAETIGKALARALST